MSPENTDPLAGLDSIDWSKLNHAYGPAGDVLHILRKLQSINPDVYKTALDTCWSNIYYQGTRYSASVATIPFLYALLDSQATKDGKIILFLIVSLGIGDLDWAVPTGIDIQEWEQRIASMEPPNRAYAMYELKAYEAVERGLSSMVCCLNEDSASLRANAAHALAFFPCHSDASRLALLDILSRETSYNIRGIILLLLAVLYVRANDDSEKQNVIEKIQEYYAPSSNLEADDIFKWSCVAALLLLGSKKDGLVETVQRVHVDEAYLSKLEPSIDSSSWFPFAALGLRELATSILESHQK